MKEWIEFTKEELLQLPERKWGNVTKYSSVLFVNTRKKHSSGYNLFAIIGCADGTHPTEVCGYMDSFQFDPYLKEKIFSDTINAADISFDCSMKGVFRLFSKRKIYVQPCTSTTNWWLGERL